MTMVAGPATLAIERVTDCTGSANVGKAFGNIGLASFYHGLSLQPNTIWACAPISLNASRGARNPRPRPVTRKRSADGHLETGR